MNIEVSCPLVSARARQAQAIARQERRFSAAFKVRHPVRDLDALRALAESKGVWMAVAPTHLDSDGLPSHGRLFWAGDDVQAARRMVVSKSPRLFLVWLGSRRTYHPIGSHIDLVLRSL